MRFKNYYILCVLLISSLSALNAQNLSNHSYLKLGDEMFQERKYFDAVVYYEASIYGPRKSTLSNKVNPYGSINAGPGVISGRNLEPDELVYAKYRLGESYRLTGNFIDAEKAYLASLRTSDTSIIRKKFPLARYWLAKSLKANAKYDQAIAEFNRFAGQTDNEQYQTIAKQEAEICREAKARILSPLAYSISKIEIPQLKGPGSNFSIALIDSSKIIFSAPTTKPTDEERGVYTIEPVNHLFVARKNGQSWASPTEILFKLPGYDNFGTPVLNQRKDQILFTAWNFDGKVSKAAIFKGDFSLVDFSIKNIKALNEGINLPGTLNMHPSLTNEDQDLLFTSDRGGGKGGKDIWWAQRDSLGDFSKPKNMGSEINTSMDELTPFYDDSTHVLYYSSNGHLGIGGLDIYQAEGELSALGTSYPLAYPVNSSRDDAYFMVNPINGKGFFCSDRASKCCYEMYAFEFKGVSASGQVIDKENGLGIKNALISLTDSISGNVIQELVADDLGKFEMKDLAQNVTYGILINSPKYEDRSFFFDTNGLAPREKLEFDQLLMDKRTDSDKPQKSSRVNSKKKE